jgi:hypothetical protein
MELAARHGISTKDVDMIFLSPSPYENAFEEVVDLRLFSPEKHSCAGLHCHVKNGRLILVDIHKSTPAAKIRAWRSRLRGAWIIQVNGNPVSTIADLEHRLLECKTAGASSCTILMAHSVLRDGLVEEGIPQVNADMLNNRYSFENTWVMTQEQYDRWFATLPTHLYDLVDVSLFPTNSLVVSSSTKTIGVTGNNPSSFSLTSTKSNTCLATLVWLPKRVLFSTSSGHIL